MDAEEILAKAKTLVREKPDATSEDGWIIFPLLRNRVIVDSVGWVFSTLVGLGLFVAVALGTIPYNFQHGVGTAVIATILLALTLFIGLGSIWALYGNIRRLREAERHIIVITPDDFLQQEGAKIVHVPLEHVRYVTARGDRAPDRTAPKGESVRDIPGVGENVTGFFLGRQNTPSGMKHRRGRMRTPTTLAFTDTRTNSDVVVVSDRAYGDPYIIAAFLKQYTGATQRINT